VTSSSPGNLSSTRVSLSADGTTAVATCAAVDRAYRFDLRLIDLSTRPYRFGPKTTEPNPGFDNMALSPNGKFVAGLSVIGLVLAVVMCLVAAVGVIQLGILPSAEDVLRLIVWWILALMYFCYNFNLNVYNDWFPTYLHDSRGMTLAKMGFYASLPLFAGTLGDLAGGWFSDHVLRRTGNVNLARRWVAIAGFLVSASATIPATLAADPRVSVALYSVAFFALEWTVGISWAIPLDIGGDFAGSVSAVMNTLGNIGGAVSATVVTYAVKSYGWNAPFFVTGALCLIAAALYLKIDATKRIAV